MAVLGGPKYTLFRVTNPRGELLAEWIAEGVWWRSGDGYEIRAVQHRSGPPFPQTDCYPNGIKTVVAGPNIVRRVVAKPEWLAVMDGKAASVAERSAVSGPVAMPCAER